MSQPRGSPFADPPAHLCPAKRQPAPLELRPESKFDDDKRQSGFGALGMGLMNMDDDSDDEDGPAMQVPPARTSHRSPPTPDLKQAPGAIPLAAPRPGYVAQAINLARPPPSATPNGRSRADDEKAQLCGAPPAYAPSTPGTPRGPPSSPHPLNLPVTPIQPVFARPRKQEERDVKFSSGIIRGNKEDALIPRRGEKGDDFWRRFSMVAHDQATKSPKEKESSWLRKTQNGTNRMSRSVWAVGLVLLCAIGAGIGFGYYFTHQGGKDEVQTAPTAIGGSAGHGQMDPTTTSAKAAAGVSSSTARHVSPTNTVERRSLETPVAAADPMVKRHAQANARRSHLNRGLELD